MASTSRRGGAGEGGQAPADGLPGGQALAQVHERPAPDMRRTSRRTDHRGQAVEHEGEEEELDADEEEDRVVAAAEDHLAHLGGDGGRQRPDRVAERPGGHGGVARGHQHDHGLADGAAEAEHHRRQHAGRGGRQHHAEGGLPAGGSQRQRGLAVGARHRGERVLAHREDDRDDGERQRQPGHHRVEPGGEAEGRLQPGGQHHQGEEAEHHRGDPGQQLDGRLEHLAQPCAARTPRRRRPPPRRPGRPPPWPPPSP